MVYAFPECSGKSLDEVRFQLLSRLVIKSVSVFDPSQMMDLHTRTIRIVLPEKNNTQLCSNQPIVCLEVRKRVNIEYGFEKTVQMRKVRYTCQNEN